MSRRSIVAVICIAAAIGCLSASPALAAAPGDRLGYGPLRLLGTPAVAAADTPDSQDLALVALSDQQSLAMFSEVWGAQAAATAHRVTTSEALSIVEKPVKYATMVADGSDNWCGYESKVSGIDGVECTFTVRNNISGYQGTWTGMGDTNRILQTGIDGYRHQAWIEDYPHAAVYLPNFTVYDGDVINASVGLSKYSSYWYVVIYDATTGQYGDAAYTGSVEHTADWMVEAPNGNGSIGHFGTINFSSCRWWNSAFTTYNMNVGSGYYYKTSIYNDGGTLIASPSAISGGTAFSISH